MKAVLIGTRAYREQWNDTDILCDQEFKDYFLPKLDKTTPEFEFADGMLDGKPVELTVVQPGTAFWLALEHSPSCQDEEIAGELIPRAQLKLIATLKKAHLVNPKRFEHHIREYSYIKDVLGVKWFKPSEWDDGDSKLVNIFQLHRREVKKKHPKLNTSKDGFFSHKESYNIMDHDSVHEAVSYPLKPAYLAYKGDEAEVWCDKDKWLALPEAERIRGVVEESCVLALERSILPALFPQEGAKPISFWGAERAYAYALSKVCTTITSGFFREYAIENYDECLASRPDYVNKFFEGVKLGVVKKFEKAAY